MGKILKKSDIFAKKALEPRSIFVEEWSGDVWYKPMTMLERREIRKQCMVSEIDKTTGESKLIVDQEKLELWAIICCCVDGDNKKESLFTQDDITVLEEEMAAGPITTVSQAILRASGLVTDAVQKSKAITEE